MRLQIFDTLCLQVDRHGSNFKCKVDPEAEKKGRIVITEVMSYDHDMSFGEETLDNAFKDPVTKQEEKKERLSPFSHYQDQEGFPHVPLCDGQILQIHRDEQGEKAGL